MLSISTNQFIFIQNSDDSRWVASNPSFFLFTHLHNSFVTTIKYKWNWPKICFQINNCWAGLIAILALDTLARRPKNIIAQKKKKWENGCLYLIQMALSAFVLLTISNPSEPGMDVIIEVVPINTVERYQIYYELWFDFSEQLLLLLLGMLSWKQTCSLVLWTVWFAQCKNIVFHNTIAKVGACTVHISSQNKYSVIVYLQSQWMNGYCV